MGCGASSSEVAELQKALTSLREENAALKNRPPVQAAPDEKTAALIAQLSQFCGCSHSEFLLEGPTRLQTLVQVKADEARTAELRAHQKQVTALREFIDKCHTVVGPENRHAWSETTVTQAIGALEAVANDARLTEEYHSADVLRRDLIDLLRLLVQMQQEVNARDGQLQEQNQQVEVLQHQVQSHEKRAEAQQSQIESQEQHVDTLVAQLSSHDKELGSLLAKIELQDKHLRKLLIKQLCIVAGKIPMEEQKRGFYMWKSYEVPTEPAFTASESVPEEPLPEMLNDDNLEIMENNPLIQTLHLHRLSGQKPLSPLVMLRFVEGVLDKKFDSDTKDLMEERVPKSMADFLLEHLHRSFGIENIAIKYLSQLVPALHRLYLQEHPYATWFCRLFQLFHPEPLPFPLAIFLTRLRMDFHNLVDKYDRVRVTQGKKPSGFRSKSKNKDALAQAEIGGLGFLADVAELIQQKFGQDKSIGIALIEAIRPSMVSQKDYVNYWICHKIRKMGSTPETVFNMIDIDHSGVIDAREFVQGMKGLDIWISEESIHALAENLNSKGGLTKASFLSTVNMNIISKLNHSDHMVVRKSNFLSEVTSIYMNHYRLQANDLFKLFHPNTEIDIEKFTEVLGQVAPHLSAEAVTKLFEETGANPVTDPRTCVKLLLNYSLGCKWLTSFAVPELQVVQLENLQVNDGVPRVGPKLMSVVKEMVSEELVHRVSSQ